MRHLFLILLLAVPQAWAELPVFSVRELKVDFSPFTVVAAPGESLVLPLVSGTLADATVEAPEGVGTRVDLESLSVDAPAEPGFYPVVVQLADGRQRQLQLFVMVPATDSRSGNHSRYLWPAP